MNERAPANGDEIRLSAILAAPVEEPPARLDGERLLQDVRRAHEDRLATDRFVRSLFVAFLAILAFIGLCAYAGGVMAAASQASESAPHDESTLQENPDVR